MLEPAPEQFRDREHLLDVVARLTRLPPSGIAEFRLRDGSEGTLVVPPAAPAGPVLILRRGEPGAATFERLIASEMLDRRDRRLLRIAVRCRLDVLIAGPAGFRARRRCWRRSPAISAMRRGSSPWRAIASFAGRRRRRSNSWRRPTGRATASLSALLAAGVRLRPDLLLVDSVRPSERGGAGARLCRVANGRRSPPCRRRKQARSRAGLDLVRSPGRTRDGLFRVVSVKDSSGARLFVHENGRFQRGTAQPAFAGSCGSGLRRGAFDRPAIAAATGRHIPSGGRKPVTCQSISGTNRLEMRGILRVGILREFGAAEGDGCMIGKRVLGILGVLSAIAVLGVASSARRAAGHRRAARLADGFSGVLHAADGEGRVAARPSAGDHHR